MRGAERCDGVYVVALAAGEQRGDVVGRGCRLLIFAAVCEQSRERSDRRAAERVTDEIYLLYIAVRVWLAPALNHGLCVGSAVAAVVEFLGVRLAVVNASAGYLCVELAYSVPVARHRADGCGIAFIVKLVQLVHERA